MASLLALEPNSFADAPPFWFVEDVDSGKLLAQH
jgi:hypothetical protein